MSTNLVNAGGELMDFLHHGGSLTTVSGSGVSIPRPFAKPILLLKTYIAGMFFEKNVGKFLEPLEKDSRLTLLREPENKYDKFAIRVQDAQGNRLGYVPRQNNMVIANLMDAGKVVYATVREKRWNGNTPDVTIDLFMED